MPTPHELEVAKRQDVLRRHGNDFYVQEVVELMDSDDTDAGEEDLPRDERTSARKARRAEAARARREAEARAAVDREQGRGAYDVQQQAQAHVYIMLQRVLDKSRERHAGLRPEPRSSLLFLPQFQAFFLQLLACLFQPRDLHV